MLEGESGTLGDIPGNPSSIFNNKTRLLVVGSVMAIALAYLVYAAFPGNTLYYLTVSEFLSDGQSTSGKSVRVVGKLLPESFERVPDTVQANFILTDEGQTLAATYNGVLPDLFFNPHSDVVLEGSYGEDGIFQAHDLIVKCPSKFQALRDEA